MTKAQPPSESRPSVMATIEGVLAGTLPKLVDLQVKVGELSAEMDRLREIEAQAQAVYDYHLQGRAGRAMDGRWDMSEMIERLDRLGKVMKR